MKKRALSVFLVLCMVLSVLPMTAHAAEVASGTYGDNLSWVLTEDGVLTISGEGAMKETELVKTESGRPAADLPWREYQDIITSVVIGEGVTTVSDFLFFQWGKISQISLPSTLTYIGDWAFQGCGLTTVEIPDSVTSIGQLAFSYCKSLRSVRLPAGLSKAGANVFANCDMLTEVIMPIMPNLKSLNEMFWECYALTNLDFYTQSTLKDINRMQGLVDVTVPDCVETVGNSAFWRCDNLKRVIFPSSVKTVGERIFGNCPLLKSVYFTGDAPTLTKEGDVPFADYIYAEDGALTVYYPAGNESWTEEVMINFGGNVTWQSYEPGTEPEPVEHPFNDVPVLEYYHTPVLWAVGKGITAGTAAGVFSPDETCTRAQVVTFLWRSNGCPEPESTENPFTDVKETEYYYKAVLWAVENGITSGTTATTFEPDEACTRAQVVTFLSRSKGWPENCSKENPFTDVAETEYYYAPVLWALNFGVTSGTSATTFSPNDLCTRAQVVTFLYRASQS